MSCAIKETGCRSSEAYESLQAPKFCLGDLVKIAGISFLLTLSASLPSGCATTRSRASEAASRPAQDEPTFWQSIGAVLWSIFQWGTYGWAGGNPSDAFSYQTHHVEFSEDYLKH